MCEKWTKHYFSPSKRNEYKLAFQFCELMLNHFNFQRFAFFLLAFSSNEIKAVCHLKISFDYMQRVLDRLQCIRFNCWIIFYSGTWKRCEQPELCRSVVCTNDATQPTLKINIFMTFAVCKKHKVKWTWFEICAHWKKIMRRWMNEIPRKVSLFSRPFLVISLYPSSFFLVPLRNFVKVCNKNVVI